VNTTLDNIKTNVNSMVQSKSLIHDNSNHHTQPLHDESHVVQSIPMNLSKQQQFIRTINLILVSLLK